jgi:hypothetical protein
MGQGADDMGMITGQEPRLLEGKPALGLEVRTLRTGPMPTRGVPDTGDVAVGARLEMTAQGGRPALGAVVTAAGHLGLRWYDHAPRTRLPPPLSPDHSR